MKLCGNNETDSVCNFIAPESERVRKVLER